MLKLIKNVNIYTPAPIGMGDILACAGKIIAIGPSLTCDLPGCEIIEGRGMTAVPGFIDQHVHVLGGGGESGFKSRVSELHLTDCIESGVTTLVGMLGTDGVSRSIENLVAKVKGLNEEGITAYCLTGSYEYPSPTLTGTVKKDVAYISEVIGVKIAISDHRSSNISRAELARLATEVRIGALLSGKVGEVHMHLGAGNSGLKDIVGVIEETDIPIKHFRPTHVAKQLSDAYFFNSMGGYIDFTSGTKHEETAKQLCEALATVDNLGLVTLSSDSNGSMPIWSETNALIGMGTGKMTTLFATVRAMVQEEGIPLEKTLMPITENVAKALELYPRKGALQVGSDADILLLDGDLHIDFMMAKGQVMLKDKQQLVTGYFGK